MFKKLILFTLSLMLISMQLTSFFADGKTYLSITDNDISIFYNEVKLPAAAITIDEQLFIPVRSICEAAGFNVLWNGKDRSVSVSNTDKSITLKLDDRKVSANDHEFNLSSEAVLINEKTYVPLGFATDCLSMQAILDTNNSILNLKKIQENAITITPKKELSETASLTLNIEYPQISGLSNPDVQDKINATFEKLAMDAKAEAVKDAQELASDPITSHMKVDEYLNYVVKYNQNNLLSVVFQNYLFSGGAHGSTIQSSYTYNLSTGELYQLKDLFVENADYVSIISAEVQKQMEQKGLTEALLVPFTAINPNQGYYLTNDSIVVYFQQYEYFPYVYGITEYAVPFSQLNQLLKSSIYQDIDNAL